MLCRVLYSFGIACVFGCEYTAVRPACWAEILRILLNFKCLRGFRVFDALGRRCPFLELHSFCVVFSSCVLLGIEGDAVN